MIQSQVVLAAGILTGCLAVANPTHAETRTLFNAGLWSTYGGTDERQHTVCGIASVGADRRRIAIQQSAGETDLEIVLEKATWAIPENTPIEVVLQVDTYSWHNCPAASALLHQS